MFFSTRNFLKISCLFGLSFFANSVVAQTPIFVDKELILEIDVSDSISPTEYDTLIEGYAGAFRDPTIQSKIEGLSDGVAVGLQFFSSGQTMMFSNADEYLNETDYDPTSAGNTALSSYFATNAQWFILKDAENADEFGSLLDELIGFRPEIGNDTYTVNSGLCDTDGFFADSGNGNGLGSGTNIAGAIQQGTCEINRINQRYSLGGVSGDALTGKIVASYEQAIDISSDGVQNTKLTGENPFTTDGINVNGACNDTVLAQAYCQTQLTTAQGQSANLGRSDGDINNGIINSPNFEWDSPITRINGLPVNNDVAFESDYFSIGYDQPALGGGSTTVGRVVGGVDLGATDSILDNTFQTGVGVNGSFIVSADDYEAFEPAIVQKIQQELEPVPFEFKPGFGLLLGLGIFALRQWFSHKTEQKTMAKKETENKIKNDYTEEKLLVM